MEDRITVRDAAHILQVSKDTVLAVSRQQGWDAIMGGKGLRKGVMFLRSEVLQYMEYRKKNHMPIKFERSNKSDETAKIVAWADSLTKWQTDAEIEAHTSDVYRIKDVESVIDVRVFRKAINPKTGKKQYLKPLRQPAMNRSDTVGRMMRSA